MLTDRDADGRRHQRHAASVSSTTSKASAPPPTAWSGSPTPTTIASRATTPRRASFAVFGTKGSVPDTTSCSSPSWSSRPRTDIYIADTSNNRDRRARPQRQLRRELHRPRPTAGDRARARRDRLGCEHRERAQTDANGNDIVHLSSSLTRCSVGLRRSRCRQHAVLRTAFAGGFARRHHAVRRGHLQQPRAGIQPRDPPRFHHDGGRCERRDATQPAARGGRAGRHRQHGESATTARSPCAHSGSRAVRRKR